MISLALALSLLVPASAAKPCAPQKAEKTAALTFPDGKTIKVDVVDTPKSRETGLMCRTSLPMDYGMLFVFPQEMGLGFWMKNTLVPLDLLWLGKDKRVTHIAEKLPASRADSSDAEIARAGGYGQYVLELPAGAAARYKLKVGDVLKFETAIPKR